MAWQDPEQSPGCLPASWSSVPWCSGCFLGTEGWHKHCHGPRLLPRQCFSISHSSWNLGITSTLHAQLPCFSPPEINPSTPGIAGVCTILVIFIRERKPSIPIPKALKSTLKSPKVPCAEQSLRIYCRDSPPYYPAFIQQGRQDLHLLPTEGNS